MVPATDNTIVRQLEIFNSRGFAHERIAFFTLDLEGMVRLNVESSNPNIAAKLNKKMESGVPSRSPNLGPILPGEGESFIQALSEHYQSTSGFKVRDTSFPSVAIDPGPLRDALVHASNLVRSARDLSAAAMPLSEALATGIESHTKDLELLRDKIHDALLSDHDKASGASPRLEPM